MAVARLPRIERALAELERSLGPSKVVSDAELLQRYAIDESEVTPRAPDCAVIARSTIDVATTLRIAEKHGVAVTPRAGGTGRTGGSVPVDGGIVLTFERMNELRGVEPDDLLAVAEPGLIAGRLHEMVEGEGLFYPPDPNSLDSCAIGGTVAENAGGPRAFKYGVTREYVLGLEVVLMGGQVLRLGRRTVKGVTGYDLTALVVGSEGTLAVITEVTLKLVRRPTELRTLVALFPDVGSAGTAVTGCIARGLVPRCLELLDGSALAAVRRAASLPIDARANAMLLLEVDGDDATHVDRELERCGSACADAGAIEVLVAKDGTERARLWSARRGLSRALRTLAKSKLAEDVVVPRSRVPDLLRWVAGQSESRGIRMPTYGHAGDGNLHVNFLWDDDGERPAVDAAIAALFREVVRMGGTLSGEHGIGVLKAPYLGLEQSEGVIDLQRRLKDTFDPHGLLNPGKIFPRRGHGPC
ncbi:MAG: FAD-binding protein [Deltaproteobacteria bacterium]|nr:FAD-binding protein [Deltaproteobacteria bacterium]